MAYLITARSWDYLKGFLGVFASCEEDFVSLIDGMYPTEKPADVSARDSMQLEAQNVFLAVDDLYQVQCSSVGGSMKRWRFFYEPVTDCYRAIYTRSSYFEYTGTLMVVSSCNKVVLHSFTNAKMIPH